MTFAVAYRQGQWCRAVVSGVERVRTGTGRTSAVSATIFATLSAPSPTTINSSVGASSTITRWAMSRSSSLIVRSARGQPAHDLDDDPRDAGPGPSVVGYGAAMPSRVLYAVQRTGRRVPRRVELMEVPTQPVDAPRPLATRSSRCRPTTGPPGPGRRVGRRAGPDPATPTRDRQRVDRVRLAVRARRVAGVSHQLRWHRTIGSPAASRSASRRRDRCRQSSTAHVRSSPNRSAHRTNSR